MDSVANWLAANTYHHSDFADLESLVRQKSDQNLTISICIPTRNEEATIGDVVRTLRHGLMETTPLVDEIVVVDSSSTDQTCREAAAAGAEVWPTDQILPDLGTRQGKGENLWKALYQLRGDIICYIDGDISNIHPRFGYALLGPLLQRPEIQYVKAFYDRPMASTLALHPTGGGRVTEILVRPLFSLFFPELSALIQPLSGEYAVRRSTLESIPFPVGYAVETSHLLDVYHQHGLPAFAQVDLDRRVHHNQSTYELGKMAFGILRMFQRRLVAHGLMLPLDPTPDGLRQFQAHSKDYQPILHEITEEERPPMIELPAYRQKFGRPRS